MSQVLTFLLKGNDSGDRDTEISSLFCDFDFLFSWVHTAMLAWIRRAMPPCPGSPCSEHGVGSYQGLLRKFLVEQQ